MQKKSTLKKVVLTSLLFSTTVFAQTTTPLAVNIDKLIKASRLKPNELGIIVEDEGKTIVNINAEKMMVPASLTKIITGGATLSQLSLNKKFTTELLANSAVVSGALKGNLCLKGGGDPSFVSESMWVLVNEFTRNEIKVIEGDLIVDSTRFDSEFYDKGRDSKRVDRAFDAPISATSFNWNSITIYVRPGAKAGDPVKVFLTPESSYLTLENKATTSGKLNEKAIEASRVKSGNKDKIIVTGKLATNLEEIVIYKSISNPPQWTAAHLLEFFKQRGIEVKGTIREAECEANSRVLARQESKKLPAMANDMLKYSNNYVSEMLAKNLSAEKKQILNQTVKNASMDEGIESIKTYLDQVGLKRSDYVLDNVSGLTRSNRFSAKQLSNVLTFIQNDFLIYPEFLAGLPIGGVDGTLKNRMNNDERFGFVRAKTGYLDGVVGLAGYVGRRNQSPYVFVFMYNGSAEKGYDARVLFDNLSKELLKN